MQVTIEKMVYGGAGLVRTADGVIFVPRSAPGDVLKIEIAGRKKDYAIGRITEILTPSPDRQTPDCPNYLTAGCCHWQHLRYERQLEYKDTILRESLKRGGHIEWSEPIRRICGPERNYRMRATFHIQDGRLGFIEEGSHTVVPIHECASLLPALNRFIDDANKVIASPNFHDLKEVHVIGDSELAATFAFSDDAAGSDGPAWDRICDAIFSIPGMASLTIRAGSHRMHVHKNVPTITVAGNSFELSSDAFFQANRFMLEPFSTEVCRQSSGAFHLLELYCGAGFFSVPLSRVSRELIGIESSGAAVRHAKNNLKTNGVFNANLVVAEVEASLSATEVKPDTVILNPPRVGAGLKVATRLAAIRPRRIVYISCNPTTLAREARVFIEKGYALKELSLIDQFPNTYHIESVARFDVIS